MPSESGVRTVADGRFAAHCSACKWSGADCKGKDEAASERALHEKEKAHKQAVALQEQTQRMHDLPSTPTATHTL